MLLSFTAAAYPAITSEPKLLMILWMMIFPIDTKPCCRVLLQHLTEDFSGEYLHLLMSFVFILDLTQPEQHNDHGQDTAYALADKCRPRDTCHAHMKALYKQDIYKYVRYR